MGIRVDGLPEGLSPAREGAAQPISGEGRPVLTVLDGSVALVRVGRNCSASVALEVLHLCRAALIAGDEVIIDLRQVSEVSMTAAALLTRGVRNLSGRVRLLPSDELRDRLTVLGGRLD